MGRFNALIATHKELQTMLSHDAFNLERRIANELQVRLAGQALELLLMSLLTADCSPLTAQSLPTLNGNTSNIHLPIRH